MCFFGTQIKNTLTCVFLARIIILNEVIIVKNLKKLRDEHNLTQQQMADIFGLQRPTYTRYEKGERQPDFETLIKISDYFNVSVDYLLGKEEKKSSTEEPIIIRRLRKGTDKMDKKQQEKMMNLLKLSFEGLFDEDD
jgi:transcriptional regulator with XRE-family HTH domain